MRGKSLFSEATRMMDLIAFVTARASTIKQITPKACLQKALN
jgi:hypothetical protein